jgi:hypothetical protein
MLLTLHASIHGSNTENKLLQQKEIFDLIHFRADIAETLITSNITPTRKRGRPSRTPTADLSPSSAPRPVKKH